MQIRIAFHGVGSYVLHSTAVDILQIVGGDGIFGSYQGIGSKAGVLEITAYGGPGGNIDETVRFDARNARVASTPILHFENGRFHALVELPELRPSPLRSR